jgi:uncharacterized protein (TIGR02246 family)
VALMSIPTEVSGDVPADLLTRFWQYDAALLANDQDAMDDLFAPGPATLRGDGQGVLVGHDAISGFRSQRRRTPTRRVAALHIRRLADDLAAIVATTTEPIGGGFGLQTQVWRKQNDGQWRVEIAHVSAVAPPSPATDPNVDRAIWRDYGTIPASSSAAGPLRGRSVAVKDLFGIAGHPIGAGVPAWLAEQQPQESTAPVVQALLDAGAHIAGIAQTDEFAYSIAGVNSHYGAAPNATVPHATSGGSSSGPASAVAAGQADIGLGTDTAGSIRVPASYTGLVGLRTTHGRLPKTGVVALAPDFDTVGWLTHDLSTAQAVGEVLFAESAPDALQPQRMLTVPALRPRLTSLVRSAFDAALDQLTSERAIAPIEEAEWTAAELDRWFTSFRTWQGWQAWQQFGPWITAHPDGLGPEVAARFHIASQISERDAMTARDVVHETRELLRATLEGAVLVLPTTATSAPPRTASIDQLNELRDATLRLTGLASIGGLPALSLPVLSVPEPWLQSPSPVGLCLVGPVNSDLQLIKLAQGLPEILDGSGSRS